MKQITCNVCGKTIENENGHGGEDFLLIRKEWGYFSRKDGEIHKWCVCEDCYDRLVASLAVPPDIHETTEFV